MRRAAVYARMIKFSHTAFALPFALASLAFASRLYGFRWETLLWVTLAMAGARSAAMMMNRIADRDVDALNPRTRERELPSGEVTLAEAWVFLLAAATLFVYAAHRLNPLCFALSPAALAVVWGYSFMKRFTWASHLGLGLALGIAPVGAWLAVAGAFAWPPAVLAAAVTLWVAGFDILYACQDIAFDARMGLHSVPARFGAAAALRIAAYLHLLAFLLLGSLHLFLPHLGAFHALGVLAAGALMLWEHSLVRPGDFSKIPAAFFTVNALLGAVYFAFVLADALL
jgi:4-hydroxybenzoate polyprenyltransferase